MAGLLRDIRYSVRSLRKRPVFSFLVVLALAVAPRARRIPISLVRCETKQAITAVHLDTSCV